MDGVPDVSTLAEVLAVAGRHGYDVERAVPRASGHALVQLRRAGSGTTAAQWFADPERARAVTSATRLQGSEARLLGDHLLVQPGGADRRLPTLRMLAERSDTVLVAHSPERRGVLRSVVAGRTTWVKVVRPHAVAAVAGGLRAATAAGVPAPLVLSADPVSGVVRTAPLAGRSLHDLLADPLARPDALRTAGGAVGVALRRLHESPLVGDLGVHGAADELAVTRRWVDLATAEADLPPERAAALARGLVDLESLLGRRASQAPRVVGLHRDLHDKQVHVAGPTAGLLDLDLRAAGDAALDLANLLVHLRLRLLQGRCDAAVTRAATDGVLAGYDPDDGVRAGLDAHALASRLRLVAVYAFRPRGAEAAARLLDDAAGDGWARR